VKLTLPLFVQNYRPPDQSGSVYVVRPLFFPAPEERDAKLSRAMAKVVRELKKLLENLGSAGQHRELADWTFAPDVELEQHELRLDLREQMFHGYFPVVSFRRLGRRVAFCPHVPEVWFEVHRGETVRDRAAAVFQQHFRRLRRKQENVALHLAPLARKHQTWITNIDLEIDTRQELKKPAEKFFALLGGAQEFHGGHELQRVGRCLDWRYPDGLHRARRREELASRLEELLTADDKRPVLLVGPRLAGKTALVHEFVYRKVARQASAYQSKRNVWLVSPQRLISGMSYVGQWENRLLAIVRHVRRKGHTLYFDDLLGLYRAGISASSNLSAADVLKPYIERRQVRVLGEMTPEQLRVFRERDRGLADMFHLLRVDETDESTTLRILLASLRLLEMRHDCRFDLDVLPAAIDLTRRYVRDAAMPGKAAAFVSTLAVKRQKKSIRRSDVLEEFHATSGLDVTMLDTEVRLRRKEVIDALSNEIIGQPQALEAMADVVTIAKARLNDPTRPLGSLLFLGPTGVGKTQSAKALARYLFGDAARLVRFDMNEFVTPQSAARLAGVFDRPEGLLTSEVRRRPFSVILLDEIEKAHPDVFDLLLQVLGEGRLTDGLGRTADFTNTVIILTSNLGTRQAADRVGFERGGGGDAAVYVKAVEDFFRPEFFNRLDRIVPFNRLGRDDLARIAEMTLHDVLAREGLVRRRCALQIAPEAMDWVIERGYHPVLGARAMKRAVEQELVQPLSRQLTSIAPGVPTVLEITRPGEMIEVRTIELANAAGSPEAKRPERIEHPAAVLDGVRRALDRIEDTFRQHRPAMEFTAGAISPQQYHYLACEELLKGARQEYWRLREAVENPRRGTSGPSLPSAGHPRRSRRTRLTREWYTEPHRDVFAAQDMNEYLNDLAEQAAAALDESQIEQELRELIDHAALLEALGPKEYGWRHERILLLLRTLDQRSAKYRKQLLTELLRQFQFRPLAPRSSRAAETREAFGPDAWGLFDGTSIVSDDYDAPDGPPPGANNLAAIGVEGCSAGRLVRVEVGTHLFTDEEGRLIPVQVVAWPMGNDDNWSDALARCLEAHQTSTGSGVLFGQTDNHLKETPAEKDSRPLGAESVGAAYQRASDDPFCFAPIVRIYGHGGTVLDLRTGQTAPAAVSTQMFLSALPLPQELRGAAFAG
jgi:ATP-dependent Clp protease ATP-binding subunit ClpA